MDPVTITSLNARGLNTPEKRKILLQDLKRLRADIAFIQETHFKSAKLPFLQNRYYPSVYHAPNPVAKSKGVSILLSRHVPWTLLDVRADAGGRYLFLKGTIGSVKVTLATFYAPNVHQDTFLDATLSILAEFSEGRLILGGDLNVPLHPEVDTSAGTSAVPSGTRKRIVQSLHKHQLTDVWRILHSTERDYTYFSAPHHCYSRIDLFLIPHQQLQDVLDAQIGNITWSDHAPITLRYGLAESSSPRDWRWRLNESLLQDPDVLADVTTELSHYFLTNATPESSVGMVWEAHKAVIRGVLIKHGARIKRKREAKLNALLADIQTLETRHKRQPDISLEGELSLARRQVADLLRYRAKAAIQRCRKFSYEVGDKCGRHLARTLRNQQAAAYVPQITDASGHKVVLPGEIARSFGDYYSTLYNITEQPPSRSSIDEYLSSACLPRLTSEQQQALEAPVTMEELQAAVSAAKSGKAPGPDGFTSQYYKTLLPVLGPHMIKTFNALGMTSSFPPESLLATISVIHKDGKDPALCGSYRPISLLNVDLKIFTKILATRLQTYLPQLIHLDQVGFIPTREARDNTTKVLNLVHLAQHSGTPCVFLSTDAEKAFDRVNWGFMFATLRHFGVGDRMLQWIAAIYSAPTASVKVNGTFSKPFGISNGTRQGCPLSPLLFAMSLEPFLCKIRLNGDITGLRLGDSHYKLSAYADDLLFSLTNPLISLPNLLQELKLYGTLSHLKINYSKSEAMGVGIPAGHLHQLQAAFRFKWTSTALKYLGTHIPPSLSDVYVRNFPPLLTTVGKLLETWHRGLHSWFGRCNIIKMSILPKFLYLFQALPIAIPSGFFRQANAILTNFVWAHKKPRIQRRLLTFPRERGGLALPDIQKYHQAAHLTRVIDWCRHSDQKLWVKLEQQFSPVMLKRAPWCVQAWPMSVKSHPTIGSTAKISANVCRSSAFSTEHSPLYPILGNPLFTMGLGGGPFKRLLDAAYYQTSHYLIDGLWPTIDQLVQPDGPYALDFWSALQLHHFLHSLGPPQEYNRPLTPFETTCTGQGTLPHTLSLMYALLIAPPDDFKIPGLLKWERELGRSFSVEQENTIVRFALKSSVCTRTQEGNYKLLHRWYYTPSALRRFFPDSSDRCWRCRREEGTLLHIFWSCPKLERFWREVAKLTQRFTDYSIPIDPAFFLLHCSDIPASTYKTSVVRHLLNAAKQCIALRWREAEPPSVQHWLRRVEDIRRLEDLMLSAHHKQDLYQRTWLHWNLFIYSAEGSSLLDGP